MGLEDLIQMNIVNTVRMAYPKVFLFACPNGGYRTASTGRTLKKTGTVAGVSDLIMLYRGRVIFIEVKSQKGRQQDSQKIFQNKVEAEGHQYWIVKSAGEMLDKIKDFDYTFIRR